MVKRTLKNALLTTVTLGLLSIPVAAEMSLSGTLKDNSGKSYSVKISPETDPTPVPAPTPIPQPSPVTDDHVHPEPVPVPTPMPEPVPIPDTVANGAPASFNDSRFNGSVKVGPLTASGVVENKTIDAHHEPAAIVMRNGSTLRKVRLGNGTDRPAVREGVRIGDGTYTIEDSWLESRGTGDDHADTIQSYAGPEGGGPMNLTIRRTMVKAYNDAATAGLFVADKVHGKVTLEDVVFQGGPFGLALYSDVKTIELYAKNVCFVGPFGWRPYSLRNAGGQVVIKQWQDVYNCTIKDGKLVRGTAMQKPF